MAKDKDNLPAVQAEREILATFNAGTPMQRLMGLVLDECGGVNFLVNWAEEYPNEFVQVLMAANPTAAQSSSNTLNLNLHPSLSAGPLDTGRTFDND
jgi:hypothetical protein